MIMYYLRFGQLVQKGAKTQAVLSNKCLPLLVSTILQQSQHKTIYRDLNSERKKYFKI